MLLKIDKTALMGGGFCHLMPEQRLDFGGLQSPRLRATFWTADAIVGNALTFDTIVAENMRAAERVRHGRPLATKRALSPRPLLVPCAARAAWLPPEHKGIDASFHFARVDERQQENEELGKAVPQQLPIHVLVCHVPRHVGLAKNRLGANHPFSQDRVVTRSEKRKKVDEACETGKA